MASEGRTVRAAVIATRGRRTAHSEIASSHGTHRIATEVHERHDLADFLPGTNVPAILSKRDRPSESNHQRDQLWGGNRPQLLATGQRTT